MHKTYEPGQASKPAVHSRLVVIADCYLDDRAVDATNLAEGAKEVLARMRASKKAA